MMSRMLFTLFVFFSLNHLPAQFEQRFNIEQITQINAFNQGTNS